jgi:NAD(P)-dependent dehydrogenase (short-subunit alcohol dehydrogenase family)
MEPDKRRSAPRALPLLLAAAGAGLVFRKLRRTLRRIDFCGRTVVISGGSRGLGLELGRQFAREGARVALLARDPGELERARAQIAEAGGEVITVSCDITHPKEVEHAVATLLQSWGCIDVLINNAGIIQVAPFENMELDDFQESLEVHAWGPLHLIRAVAPHMQRRRFGRIVNISSIGGLVAVPHLLPYSMGKFALTGISDGFRGELAKDGVFVTTVAPGLMRTGSHINAFFKGQHRKEFAWFAISGANPLLSTSATQAAAKIVEACRHGDPRLIITFPARLLHVVNSLFPGLSAFGTGLAARLLPKPAQPGENALHTGSESGSFAAPSILTRPADRASEPNNEK